MNKKTAILSVLIVLVLILIAINLNSIFNPSLTGHSIADNKDNTPTNPDIQNNSLDDNAEETPTIPPTGTTTHSNGGGGGGSGGSSGGTGTGDEETNFISKEFDVNINIDSTKEIFGYELYVYFDNKILEAINVSEGNFLKQDGATTYPITDINNEMGYIRLANTRFNTQTGVSGTGILFSITFKTLSAGLTELSLQKVQIVDANLDVVQNATIKSGSASSASNNVDFADCSISV